MSGWRAAALAVLLGFACTRPRDAPRPLPSGWASSGGGPGPAVGAPVPEFSAIDQEGRGRALSSLRGPNGLLLNFNRSVVW